MTSVSILKLNFLEVRRRSELAWRAIPASALALRCDPASMSLIEQVRHVLEGEYLYGEMVRTGGDVDDAHTPWSDRPFTSVEAELAFAAPYRTSFLAMIDTLTDEDLTARWVRRAAYTRQAGDFLLRAAYHEAVHLGELLRDLRAAGLERANVWD
jgi:DinB superfamily